MYVEPFKSYFSCIVIVDGNRLFMTVKRMFFPPHCKQQIVHDGEANVLATALQATAYFESFSQTLAYLVSISQTLAYLVAIEAVKLGQ